MKIFAPSAKHALFKLNSNDIHLWIVQPQAIRQSNLLTLYRQLLSEEELHKQQSYVFENKRHSALITRAFIRDVLSHYADIPPAHWQFNVGPHGKPEIAYLQQPLKFNLSHTDDLIICAVTLEDDIGSDVEMIDRSNNFLAIAENYFSKSEYEELLSNPEFQQRDRFYDYWTLKESYIKAWGLGLAIPLNDFSFHIGPSKQNHYNDNISLSFPPHRDDQARYWRSWLFYPNCRNRIAVSVKAQSDNQKKIYQFRYFENIPVKMTRELKIMTQDLQNPSDSKK